MQEVLTHRLSSNLQHVCFEGLIFGKRNPSNCCDFEIKPLNLISEQYHLIEECKWLFYNVIFCKISKNIGLVSGRHSCLVNC